MYKVEFDHSKDLEVFAWCAEHFGGSGDPRHGKGWYHHMDIVRVDNEYQLGARVVESIIFDREKDAMMFALRWA